MTDPPLAIDIDGTLTRPDGRPGLDPRSLTLLREWSGPVVVATGKSFPYPVALCHFAGIDERVVAENGGVAYADDRVELTGDAGAARRALERFRERGGSTGWGAADTVNRWRETEVAVHREADESLLRAVADEFDLEVVDTGYAYHVKDPAVDKGTGLTAVARILGLDPGEFVAVGDSENDAAAFEVADRGYAVANADDAARAAADEVLEGAHVEGAIEALDRIRERYR